MLVREGQAEQQRAGVEVLVQLARSAPPGALTPGQGELPQPQAQGDSASGHAQPARRRSAGVLTSRYQLLRSPWLLPGILIAQAALSARLVWANTAFQDESLYLWAGHLELAHLLHGSGVPAFQTYFSGAPVVYPPLAALADSAGGLAGARLLSLAFMMTATVLLYLTAKRLFSRGPALAAAALFAAFGMADQLGAFATYDAMALCLLALAAWLVVRARGRFAEPLLIAAACCLALADATKYATVLWNPVVIALAVLAVPEESRLKRCLSGVRLTSYTLVLVAAAIHAGGSSYLRGISFTTLSRQIVTGTAPLKIVDIAWGWLALLLLLALMGVLLLWLDNKRPNLLPIVLFAAVLLAPAEQARISDITSLHKHVVFGAWFALHRRRLRGHQDLPARQPVVARSHHRVRADRRRRGDRIFPGLVGDQVVADRLAGHACPGQQHAPGWLPLPDPAGDRRGLLPAREGTGAAADRRPVHLQLPVGDGLAGGVRTTRDGGRDQERLLRLGRSRCLARQRYLPEAGHEPASLPAVPGHQLASVVAAPSRAHPGLETHPRRRTVSKHRRSHRSAGIRASVTVIPAALLGVIGGGEIAMHVQLTGHRLHPDLPVYGYAVLAFLAFKLGLAILYRPPPRHEPGLDVAAIITVCNEDPLGVHPLPQVTAPADAAAEALTVIDDGSKTPDCLRLARSYTSAFERLGVRYRVFAHDPNLGKREGLADGFRAAWQADVYLCIDSDTELKANALEKAIAYFSNPRVQAVTGCVLASNWDTNFLTRLIDLRYANAFLGERAAYSAVGSVLCACGSLALYRGEVVRKYLDDFLNQRFLGQQCTYGDDRRLTYYCLREGQVLLAPDAVAWTMVPERMDHFLRQQLRWSKSFIRESWCMLTSMPLTRMPWWLSLLEVTTWAAFTSALIYTLIARPLLTGQLSAASYLAATLLLAYARSGHYFRAEHANLGRFTRLLTFALAPVYGLVHMILLLPLRLVAIMTLRDNSWGTRTTVEVRAT